MIVRVRTDAPATLRTLRHEIVQALIHEWIGSELPAALEEGLATYFAEIQTRSLGGVVNVSRLLRGRAQLLQAENALRWRSQLSRDSQRFHGGQRSAHYDASAAMIAGLMADTETRRLLADLLRTQRKQSCRKIEADRLVERSWAGGVEGVGAAVAQTWRTGRAVPVHAFLTRRNDRWRPEATAQEAL